MTRRIHVPTLGLGELPLDKTQAHHARDVLRLPEGCVVQVFDDAGATAAGVLLHLPTGKSAVRVARIDDPSAGPRTQWTIAAAVPKGDRADWMVEKLSELGAASFIPLATARSIVLPEGRNKRERWMRIATEAAKQSKRIGVMRIEELTPLDSVLKTVLANPSRKPIGDETARTRIEKAMPAAWVLATELPAAIAIADAVAIGRPPDSLTIFVGPEGGWTTEELSAFAGAGVVAVRLGSSILRVETAAIAAGAIVSAFLP